MTSSAPCSTQRSNACSGCDGVRSPVGAASAATRTPGDAPGLPPPYRSSPHLPPDALDPDWPGGRARALFADLYRRLSPAANAHIARTFATANGDLPAENEATRRWILALAET